MIAEASVPYAESYAYDSCSFASALVVEEDEEDVFTFAARESWSGDIRELPHCIFATKD